MTKEAYFEMCEALNSEPLPEEIPIEFSDLKYETQLAVQCYGMLSDNWSSMGTYLGKHMSDTLPILELNGVDTIERDYIIGTIQYIDSIVAKDIARKQKQSSKK